MNTLNADQSKSIIAIAKALTALSGDQDVLRVASSCARVGDGLAIRTSSQLACDYLQHASRAAQETEDAFSVVRPNASRDADTLAEAGEKARAAVAAAKLHAACVVVSGWYQSLPRSQRVALSAVTAQEVNV